MQLLPCSWAKFTAVRSDRYASARGTGARPDGDDVTPRRPARRDHPHDGDAVAGGEEILTAAGRVVEELEEEGDRDPEQQARSQHWTDLGSNGIEGGVSRRLSKGDVVIIPGGVPHGWASAEGDITYLIVRSDPEKKIALK